MVIREFQKMDADGLDPNDAATIFLTKVKIRISKLCGTSYVYLYLKKGKQLIRYRKLMEHKHKIF